MKPTGTFPNVGARADRFQTPTSSFFVLRITAVLIAIAAPCCASNNNCPAATPRPISRKPAQSIAVSITASPTSGKAPLLVNLVGSASSSAGSQIASWTWNYGDGTWCQSDGGYCGLRVSHYFAEVQTYVVSLAVTDTAGLTGTACISITPSFDSAFQIATTSVDAATTGIPYYFSFAAVKGKLPYTWNVTSGHLPVGIALESNGVLTNTPDESGQFNFIVQARDASHPPKTAMQSFNLTVNSSTEGGNPVPAASFFGFTENDTQVANFPTVTYGMQRFWDSPPLQWVFLNPASGVFDFGNLDVALAQDFSNGVMEDIYTLARTPPWATSNPYDSICHYTGTMPGDGNGECDPPRDLNPDGSGKNTIWKDWVHAIATQVNEPSYLLSHAHIKYWEIWNEPDSQSFFNGTIAQLARLTEDANCIITGRGAIHEAGNGIATPCTATPIDPAAQIVMPSAHAKGVALRYGQNELYCDNTAGIPVYELPCPNPPNAIANAVDIVNFHMKPGNESGDTCPAPTLCTPESAMQMYVANIESILEPAELAKPLWDGEASYSTKGFTGAYADPDMAASFIPRFYLIDWSLGISGIAWYTWDELKAEPAEVQTAYQQVYDWLVNASLNSPCSAIGTVFSCQISKSGSQFLIVWDAAQSCSDGICTTTEQPVGTQWTEYQDMTTDGEIMPILDHVVSMGIKPVVLSAGYQKGKQRPTAN